MHAAALTSSLLRALVLRDWLPSLRGRAGVNLHPGSGGTETGGMEGRRRGGFPPIKAEPESFCL